MWNLARMYVEPYTYVCGALRVCMWNLARMYVEPCTYVCGTLRVCMWNLARMYALSFRNGWCFY